MLMGTTWSPLQPQHLVEQPPLEFFTGEPEVLQLLPVDHGLVVAVLGLLLRAVTLGGLLLCFVFFAISS